MPTIPEDQRFDVVPDWVCEVLSPSTESKDREIKLPIYAQYGVAHAWLVDPRRQTLEAYALGAGAWTLIVAAEASQRIPVSPFEAVPLDLASLWS